MFFENILLLVFYTFLGQTRHFALTGESIVCDGFVSCS